MNAVLDLRLVLRVLSVACFCVAVLTALTFVPRVVRGWLVVSGGVGIAMSVSSAVANPRELTVALLASLAPVLGLVSDGSPSWLIGPLAVALLVGAELNSWSWSAPAVKVHPESVRARGRGLVVLALGGLALSLSVSAAARFAVPGQAAAVVVSSLVLAGLGWLLFRAS